MTATPTALAPRRALGEAVALLAWAACVLLVVWFVAFPLVRSDWQAAGLQVAAYVVTLLPVLLLRPRARRPAGARRVPAIIAAAVLVAGLAVAVGTGGWTGLPRQVLFAGLRVAARGLVLPTAVHVAVDLSS